MEKEIIDLSEEIELQEAGAEKEQDGKLDSKKLLDKLTSNFVIRFIGVLGSLTAIGGALANNLFNENRVNSANVKTAEMERDAITEALQNLDAGWAKFEKFVRENLIKISDESQKERLLRPFEVMKENAEAGTRNAEKHGRFYQNAERVSLRTTNRFFVNFTPQNTDFRAHYNSFDNTIYLADDFNSENVMDFLSLYNEVARADQDYKIEKEIHAIPKEEDHFRNAADTYNDFYKKRKNGGENVLMNEIVEPFKAKIELLKLMKDNLSEAEKQQLKDLLPLTELDEEELIVVLVKKYQYNGYLVYGHNSKTGQNLKPFVEGELGEVDIEE